MNVRLAETDDEIFSAYAVMVQLRPHLTAEGFVERVRRQMEGGYRLAILEDDGIVRAVAGFRMFETLAWGKILYVDDLVTDGAGRSRGYGRAMFAWLERYAREHDRDQLHLDSGVQRFGAHRFYLRERMEITSHHFALKLRD